MLVKGLRQDVPTSLITGKTLNEAAGLKVSWPSRQVYFAMRTMILSSTINFLPPSWTLKLTELGRVKNDSEGRGLQVEIAVGRGRGRRGTPLEPFVKKRLLCRLNRSLLSGFLPILCFYSRFPLVSRD